MGPRIAPRRRGHVAAALLPGERLAAEEGVFEHTDQLDDDGLPYPEHHYLTQGDLT